MCIQNSSITKLKKKNNVYVKNHKRSHFYFLMDENVWYIILIFNLFLLTVHSSNECIIQTLMTAVSSEEEAFWNGP